LAIAACWGLERNFEAFFNNLALYRLVKVEALAHTAGRGENFVSGQVELHGI
jgi:hypothetical protein